MQRTATSLIAHNAVRRVALAGRRTRIRLPTAATLVFSLPVARKLLAQDFQNTPQGFARRAVFPVFVFPHRVAPRLPTDAAMGQQHSHPATSSRSPATAASASDTHPALQTTTQPILREANVAPAVQPPVQSSPARPTHLIVLANGLFGSAINWTTILEQLSKRLDASQVLVHPSDVNKRTDTYDGIDVCGRRLADEVRGVIQRHPSLERISVIGHSMGGLLLRYAVGVSYDPATRTVLGLQPCHFITLATPHLGCDADGVAQVPFIGWMGAIKPLQGLLSAVSVPTAGLLFRRTGRQFFLADEDIGQLPGDAGLPLLARMTRDVAERKEYFMSALCSFASRTAYANTGGDHLVGWANSSLRFMHQLPDLPSTVNAAKGVVLQDDLLAAFDIRFKPELEPQRAISAQDVPVSSEQSGGSASLQLQGRLPPVRMTPPASSLAPLSDDAPLTELEASTSEAATSSVVAASVRPGSGLTSPIGVASAASPLTGMPRSTSLPSLAASPASPASAHHARSHTTQAGGRLAAAPGSATGVVQHPGLAAAPQLLGPAQDTDDALSERAHLVEEMLQRLQSLAWCRIDVSFRGAVMPFAHNHIQVTRRWLNFEGKSVAVHLAEQLCALEGAYQGLREGDEKLQRLAKRSSLEGVGQAAHTVVADVGLDSQASSGHTVERSPACPAGDGEQPQIAASDEAASVRGIEEVAATAAAGMKQAASNS